MHPEVAVLPGIGRVEGAFARLMLSMGERTPDLVVHRNPNLEQLQSMIQEAALGCVRWLRTVDGAVHVWPAWAATHEFMRRSLGYDKTVDSGIIVLDPSRGLVATK